MLPRKIVFAVCVSNDLCCTAMGSQEKNSEAGDVSLAPLGGFIGDWNCSGTFASPNKIIEAHVRFKDDLERKWILFRHDDKPPFGYHAVAEWGNRPSRLSVVGVEDNQVSDRLAIIGGILIDLRESLDYVVRTLVLVGVENLRVGN
jgi:hypothetical protein